MNNVDNLQDNKGAKRKRRAAIRPFSPVQPVLLITRDGCLTVSDSTISSNRVGWKAFGLSCLPPEWVPPFFVVDSAATELPDDLLQKHISHCLVQSEFEGMEVKVRSSGPTETIEQRGRLFSETCASGDIVGTIRRLSAKLSSEDICGVHWIVQAFVRTIRKGHLSNERRLAREPRDFIAEFEIQNDLPGYTSPVAVRHWRDGENITDLDLDCVSQAGVTLKLKQVALWATALSSRILFEWVWSGTKLWIVQADLARGTKGVNPSKLRPPLIPSIHTEALRLFRTANQDDFGRYRKLRNAKVYSEMGYQMPCFYILNTAT
jgi:hypothetical protein